MNPRSAATVWALVLVFSASALAAGPAGGVSDSQLAVARRYVEKSDRYMYHRRLRRGMTGYGLSVFAGTKIERFNVEVVSVMTKWGPHQDVILVRCSGKGVDTAGISSGMSGSPIFIQDPKDKKFKIIGALAYGWQFQKVPIAGIQPITQMLAIGGILPAARPAGKKPAGPVPAGGFRGGTDAFLATVLNPKKVDFSRLHLPRPRAEAAAAAGGPRLVPLTTPLMVSGVSRRTLARVGRDLRPLGIIPLRAGGVGAAEAVAARKTRLAPGSAVAIPVVSGDADWSAVGTVTDVIGKKVLMFGHGFFADGRVELPMGTAYIHTVIASSMSSFKLGSSLKVTGAITSDENVGVGGVLGQSVSMVPMTIAVDWATSGRKELFRYGLSRHRRLTASLAGYMLYDAILGWRQLPEFSTVRYSVSVEFDKLGRIQADNVSGAGIWGILSDTTRPVAALLENPLGAPPKLKRIDVKVRIEKGSPAASILQLVLDGRIYKPGDTVTGTVTIRPFRKPRMTLPVKFALPKDLPDGRHALTVCDADTSLGLLQREMPQRFRPRTVGQLYEALRRVMTPRSDHLYLRLPLSGGGLALATRELPDLPASKAQILGEAARLDARAFRDALVRSVKTPYVLDGSASASFEVRPETNEILINQPKDQR